MQNHSNANRRRRFMEHTPGSTAPATNPLAYCASTSRSLIVFNVATLRVKVLYVLGTGR